MLKLKELRFSGIGRFTEEQTVDFTKLGNLVQLDGKNNNTGGSSGAGKSTVFNALDYLLGINDLPSTVLKSRLSKDGISVTGIFDFDGKELKIQRSKKLSIELDGNVITGSNELAEEHLDNLIKIPRKVFRPMVHKRQKEGGFFLDFTPQKMNDFLIDCLDLGDIRKKLEIVDKKNKELVDKKTAYLAAYEQAKSGQTATQNAISMLGEPPVKDIHQETILDLKKKYEDASVVLTTLKSKHTLEKESLELSRPQVSVQSYDASGRDGLRKEIDSIQADLNTISVRERERQTGVSQMIADLRVQKLRTENNIQRGNQAMLEAKSAAEEIKKIQSSLCPTCEQTWVTEQAKNKEIALLDKVKKLKEDVMLGQQSAQILVDINQDLDKWAIELKPLVHAQIPSMQARIQELTQLIAQDKEKEKLHAQAQNDSNRLILDAFAVKQRELLSRHAQELEQASGQVDITRRAFDASVAKLRAYDEARVRYESSLKSLQAQEEKFSQNVSENLTYWTKIDEELTFVEEAKKVIKSYLSCSFDDALEYIGDVATKIIRHIPTMANSTIQLEGIKETKEGKVKEEVNAVISMDGEIGVPIKSLSGGERSSVDLAVDLAVVDLLENKTGKGIDVFILDEPFDGLDTVGIEMALEVLKNSNINKRLVIVDHNPEVKQMVESRLLVVRDGTTSKIVQS
jgi:DNA repair exonuclease SbcCD ATPase subunit